MAESLIYEIIKAIATSVVNINPQYFAPPIFYPYNALPHMGVKQEHSTLIYFVAV